MLSAVVDQLDRYMAPDSFKKKGAQHRGDLGYNFQVTLLTALCPSFEHSERYMALSISAPQWFKVVSFQYIYYSLEGKQYTNGFAFPAVSLSCAVASIPDLIKMIMLIEDEDDKQFALSTSIMRQVMMNELTIGSWVTAMLQ
jgi:hypothetical protein